MTESLFARTGGSLKKDELANIRAKAMRRGVWFRVLTRGERAQVDLTMKFVKRIRSFFLAKVLTNILEKLVEAMERRVARLTKEVGSALAQKLSGIAQNWGNKAARKWASDPGFLRYLTINYMNTPASFRT
jgi:hypothetical protein